MGRYFDIAQLVKTSILAAIFSLSVSGFYEIWAPPFSDFIFRNPHLWRGVDYAYG